MSIVWVKDGEYISHDQNKPWTDEEEKKAFIDIKECCVCGEDLWKDSFVFWAGSKLMGFHAECARHMCFGLLTDVAKLTNTLSKKGKIIKFEPRK
jgi:hypothetical protein